MELKQALAKVRKGEIVFDGSKEGSKYFLFMHNHNEVYYIHSKTINEDKKRIAVLENAKPNFLAENWWKDKWEIYNEKDTEVTGEAP